MSERPLRSNASRYKTGRRDPGQSNARSGRPARGRRRRWGGALAKRAEITSLRKDYETALEQRKAAGQKASNARAARDAAKEDFLDVYAEITARVKAEFPRDRRMQDIFFDSVWDNSAPAELKYPLIFANNSNCSRRG